MRPEWDMLLSELTGGSDDPDAGALANRIEASVLAIQRERDAARAALLSVNHEEIRRERDAYKAALEKIAAMKERLDFPRGIFTETYSVETEAAAIARAALSQQQERGRPDA